MVVPTVRWARQIGGSDTEKINSVVVNQLTDDVYVGGEWHGAMEERWSDMIGGACTGSAPDHAFIGKIKANGEYGWGDCFGGNATILAMAIAPNGDVVVVGQYKNKIDGWPGAQTSVDVGLDGFVARYTEDADGKGVRVFARRLGWSGADAATAVVVTDDNIFVAGTFEGTPTSIPLNSTVGADVFLAKLDADGLLVDQRAFGEDATEPDAHLGFHDGVLYLAGAFEGTMVFGGTAGAIGADGRDAFLAKISAADLEPIIADKYGGAGVDVANAVSAGSKYVSLAGEFASEVKLGGAVLETSTPPDGFSGLFHVADDSFFRQTQTGGENVQVTRATVAHDAFTVTAGSFESTVKFADGQARSAGVVDGFVELFVDGENVWSFPLGGTKGADVATAVDHASGVTVVGGTFKGTFKVGGETLEYVSADSTADAFVIALNDD